MFFLIARVFIAQSYVQGDGKLLYFFEYLFLLIKFKDGYFFCTFLNT